MNGWKYFINKHLLPLITFEQFIEGEMRTKKRCIFAEVKCNKLSKIQFGQVEPKSCTFGKQAFGKKCNFTCDEGFEMVGPQEVHCTGVNGAWSGKRETKCKGLDYRHKNSF